MDNYESRQLLPMPLPKPHKEMTDEELTKLLTGRFNYNYSTRTPNIQKNSGNTDKFNVSAIHKILQVAGLERSPAFSPPNNSESYPRNHPWYSRFSG